MFRPESVGKDRGACLPADASLDTHAKNRGTLRLLKKNFVDIPFWLLLENHYESGMCGDHASLWPQRRSRRKKRSARWMHAKKRGKRLEMIGLFGSPLRRATGGRRHLAHLRLSKKRLRYPVEVIRRKNGWAQQPKIHCGSSAFLIDGWRAPTRTRVREN